MPIHPTAQVDRRAELAADVDVGPYVVIEGPAQIGGGTRILAHAVITGHTQIGRDNVIHYGAILGDEPQDLKYAGAETALRIGDRNVIREHVFLHRGTAPGTSTVIGDENYIMGNAHVGHNARVGNRVILCSGALLAGFTETDDQAFISGNCVVHQYVRIGRLALLRGLSRTSRDVPPFCIMDGTHTVRGINAVGLRRAGFTAIQIRDLRRAYSRLFRGRPHLGRALAALEAEPLSDERRALLDFIRASKRGVCVGARGKTDDDE